MTDIDTSMYNKTAPQPFNPLTTIQGYASTAHTLGENKLLQQTLRGRQAMGEIIARNTDESGIVNPANALRDIAKNPDAAWMYTQEQNEFKNANPLTGYMGKNDQGQPTPMQAPYYQVAGQNNPAWQASHPQEQQSPQLTQDKIDELHAHNQAMLGVVEPLANDPDIDHKKVIRGVSDLVAHPDAKFSAMDGASALSQLPYGPNGTPPDPAQLQAKLQEVLQQQKYNEQTLSEKYPSSKQLTTRQTSPGTATGLPTGYTSTLPKSRQNYDEVADTAKSTPQTNAAYEEAINLNKAGAPTGTSVSQMYQWAAKNIPGVAQGVTDKAAQAQEIGKWMSQGLIANGMPASDARLYELQHANLNPEQLSETIKELAPFFKAVAKGAVEKQKFYNKVTNDGTDLTNEPHALEMWNSHYDPRWVEFDLAKNKKEFLMKHPDLIDKRDSYHTLQEMGVISKGKK